MSLAKRRPSRQRIGLDRQRRRRQQHGWAWPVTEDDWPSHLVTEHRQGSKPIEKGARVVGRLVRERDQREPTRVSHSSPYQTKAGAAGSHVNDRVRARYRSDVLFERLDGRKEVDLADGVAFQGRADVGRRTVWLAGNGGEHRNVTGT